MSINGDSPNNLPDVTIVVPAYNAAHTLNAALDSALVQSGAPFEVIIVDDGSTDTTLDVAREYESRDERVRVIGKRNGGTASALNAGTAAARGELIGALNADDVLSPDYMKVLIEFVRHNPGFDIYSHDVVAEKRDGSKREILGFREPRHFSLKELIDECVIFGGGTLVRKDLLERMHGYREHIYNEDYDFYLRALASGARHVYVPAPLYFYRMGEGQKSADRVPSYLSAVEMLDDLRSNYDLAPDEAEAIERRIAWFRAQIEESDRYGGRMASQVVEGYAETEIASVKRFLGRFMPADAADRTFEHMRKLSFIVRPLRKLVWAIRLRRTREAHRDH